MPIAFNKDQLLDAFDEIALAAVAAHTRLDIAVFGGSALMLASNFRYSTEDVDIAEIGRPWPDWLSEVVVRIGARNSWGGDWPNEPGSSFLSPLPQPSKGLIASGTF